MPPVKRCYLKLYTENEQPLRVSESVAAVSESVAAVSESSVAAVSESVAAVSESVARSSPRLLLPAALLLQPSNLSPFSSLLSESLNPPSNPPHVLPQTPCPPFLQAAPFPPLHSVEKSVSQG